MKEIRLTQGKVALVDDEDYDYLNQFKWCASSNHYTYYAVREDNGKKVTMARIIMNIKNNLQIDHIDRNGLNNQKHNLRICTCSQNNMNRKFKNKYKGVSFNKNENRRNKYTASIKHHGKTLFLGRFSTMEDAAIAYDRKAKELFGEFALLNFIS